MVVTIIIAFISLIVLIIIHELSHFLLAKKFGVKVEEFGIGLPPRLFGKKFGETIYSINLLPFGAFVKIYGQEERIDDSRSFTVRPFWQKSLIILGGVISFWIVAAILLSIVMVIGFPTIVEDEENHNLIDPKVQIIAIAPDSPAEVAGLEIGDTIREFSVGESQFQISKVKDLQEVIDNYKGQEITLTIQRGKETFPVSLTPRVLHPENEGPIGVALARTALISYPWYRASVKGIVATGNLTVIMIRGWGSVFASLFRGEGMPPGADVTGIVGIFDFSIKAWGLGISYFLQFIAVISVALALINSLPVPALDGGWFLFLVIERLKGKPLNQKVIQNISVAFLFLLIVLLILVTIKDIRKIFF